MHELSIAMEVVEISRREAEKHVVSAFSEIQIEIGALSGVDADSFQFSLEMVVRDTLLENARLVIERTPGRGKCHDCRVEFDMNTRIDPCPRCGCLPGEITGGTEIRVLSLVAE